MAYPDPPEITTSYTAAEQALGDGTLPGQELDVDLANVRDSIVSLISFVKTSLRSDGKLANGSVTTDTLASSLIIGFDAPAPWTAATAYTTSSTVFSGFGFYLCVTAHTSTVFATDLASGRWVLLADLTPPGGALIGANNLSDVPDRPTARGNLGLGSMSTVDAGTGSSQFRTNTQNDGRFQPLDFDLTAIAALSSAANKLPYATGVGAWALADLTAAGRALLDDADAAAQLVTLGAQPLDADLTALAALSGTGIAVRTGANTWAQRTIVSADGSVGIIFPSGAGGNIDLSAGAASVGLLTTTGAATVGPWALPAGVKRFRITSRGASLSGTGNILVQLRVAGAFVTTGYVSRSLQGSATNVNSTAGMIVSCAIAANGWDGSMEFTLHDPATNLWTCTHIASLDTTGNNMALGGGYIALAGAVDGVQINSTAGTFDVSSFNVQYG